jgi:hypothetical protein
MNALEFVETVAIIPTLKPAFGGFQVAKILQRQWHGGTLAKENSMWKPEKLRTATKSSKALRRRNLLPVAQGRYAALRGF